MPNALSDLNVTLHDKRTGRRYYEIRRNKCAMTIYLTRVITQFIMDVITY